MIQQKRQPPVTTPPAGPTPLVYGGVILSLGWIVLILAYGYIHNDAFLGTLATPETIALIVLGTLGPLGLLWIPIALWRPDQRRESKLPTTFFEDSSESIWATLQHRWRQEIDRQETALKDLFQTHLGGWLKETQQLLSDSQTVSLRGDQMRQELSQHAAEISLSAHRAAEEINDVLKTFESQITALEKKTRHLEGTLSNHTSPLTTLLETTDSTQKHIQDNIKSLDHLAAQVEKVLDTYEGKIERLADHLSKSATHFGEAISQTQNQVTTIADTVKSAQGEILQSTHEMQQGAHDVTHHLHLQTQDLIENAKKAQEHARGIRETFQRQREDLTDVANAVATQTRLGESAIEQQTLLLTTATEKTLTIIETFGKVTQVRGNEFLQLALQTEERLHILEQKMDQLATRTRQTSMDSLQNSEQTMIGLALTVEQIEKTLGGLSEKVQDMAERLKAQTTDLEFSSHKTVVSLQEALDVFASRETQMNQSTQISQERFGRLKEEMGQTQTYFDRLATSAQERIMQAVGTLSETGEILGALTNQHSQKIQKMAELSDGAFQKLALQVEDFVKNFGALQEQLTDHSKTLFTNADLTRHKLQDLLENLKTGTTTLYQVTEMIDDRTDKIDKTLQAQLSQLVQTLESSEEKIAKIMALTERTSVDSFMKETRFMMNSLLSLSVDLTKIFDPRQEDALWDRYHGGDKTAFVRHLSRHMTQDQQNLIKKAYEQNERFRGYVDRYMGEFEALLSHAAQADRRELLIGLFTSTDFGKLYMVFRKALGRAVLT